MCGHNTPTTAPLPQFVDSNQLTLPESPSDYAKALEEAYRRGAQAARSGDIMPLPVPSSSTTGEDTPIPSLKPQQQEQQQEQQQQQQRSMSLPDMSQYAANQEEEKRQKRLARNRASARLRRMRKKNLVDAYETEVGILERTLEQLRLHEWGKQDNASALVEALSMDRGQQILTLDQRKQAAREIVQQQIDYLSTLEELMAEQYVLQTIKDNPEELDDLRQELQLTDDQVERLAQMHVGWEEEWAALQTIKEALEQMKQNDWLWNDGVASVAEQFLAVLHKNQVSKFLLWTDHNAEAIDELDLVHATAEPVQEGPIFAFGVDSQGDSQLVD